MSNPLNYIQSSVKLSTVIVSKTGRMFEYVNNSLRPAGMVFFKNN